METVHIRLYGAFFRPIAVLEVISVKDIKVEMYESFLLKYGFYLNNSNEQFNPEGTCFTFLPENENGHYWVYTCDNLFSIIIQDLILFNDFYMEYPQPQFLSVSYFDSVSGEEFNPYKRMACSCIRGHNGRNNMYQALFHKNIPIRCTSIIIMPEYYEDYLRIKYPKEYEHPQEAFISIDGSTEFPELTFLLKQIKNNRSTGISAKLYYESKVAEAISLIVQKTKESSPLFATKGISQQDLDSLISVTSYIDNHFASNIHLDSLARLACMGTTKLKYTFKEVYKSTISEYILNKRIRQAEHLLANTDLHISQISQTIGYKKASSFSEIFRKTTGLLPNEYRKSMAK